MISPWLYLRINQRIEANFARDAELNLRDFSYLMVSQKDKTYTIVTQLERRRSPVRKQR